MHVVLLFFIFMHLHLASHLESREGLGVGTNPNMVLGGPIPKVEGLKSVVTLGVTKTEQLTELTQY